MPAFASTERWFVACTLAAMVGLWPFTVAAAEDGDDEPRAGPIEEVVVTSERLDTARATVEPSLGASTYSLANEAVESRPGGETGNLNQVLLQVPGVTQRGSGQLQVRGAAGELQFRIDNVILPEGLGDLGETLSPRMAANIQLVTGALPAQYGLTAAGVVNITTKSGVYGDGGQAELYGGSNGLLEPAVEYAGSVGGTNIFGTASYQRSDLGLPSPDGTSSPLHDRTEQVEGLAYADRAITANSRLSLVVGASSERFQIPNLRGGGLAGENLDERERQAHLFGSLSYLWTAGGSTVQISLYGNNSSSSFQPDERGDLLLFGLSQAIERRDRAFGLQAEAALAVGTDHTLRAGVVLGVDNSRTVTRTQAFPRDARSTPLVYEATDAETERKFSAFVQDEWHLTEAITLNAGLRVDGVSATSTTVQLGPRISLVWNSGAGTVGHIGYARYFVPPPQDDSALLAAQLNGTSGMLPSGAGDPLRAETDNYYDAGVQHAWDAVTLGVDAYWRESTYLLDAGVFGGLPSRRPFNYLSGRVRGIEFSATYADGPVSAWSNLSLSQAQGAGIGSNQFFFSDSDRAYAASRPVRLEGDQAITGSAGVSYRSGDLLVSSDLVFASGGRGSSLNGALGGYAEINLAAVYRLQAFGGQGMDLRFDVVNLLDTRYRIADGNGAGAGRRQWGARRGFFAGIEQSF